MPILGSILALSLISLTPLAAQVTGSSYRRVVPTRQGRLSPEVEVKAGAGGQLRPDFLTAGHDPAMACSPSPDFRPRSMT